MIRFVRALLGLCLLAHVLWPAEVSYRETTKITGGSVTGLMKLAAVFSKDARRLREPVITTVAVKGNRMVRLTEDYADITDLDAQTVTHIDKIKHEYSVVTFAQMKESVQRALEQVKTQKPKPASQVAAASNPAADPNVQLGFEAHVRKTGGTKMVSGLETNETILTLAVNETDKRTGQQGSFGITNDMWMAPDVPGYAEVRDCERRFATEIGSAFMTGPDLSGVIQQRQSSGAMNAMAKEMSQLQGVPVLQIMRMGMMVNGQPLAAASEAPLPDAGDGPGPGVDLRDQVTKTSENTVQQTAAQELGQRVRGALGANLSSTIAGFGFGRKKKQAVTQEPAAATPASQNTTSAPEAVVLVESRTELGNFSQQVDPSLMEVPPGYKLVPTPQLKQN